MVASIVGFSTVSVDVVQYLRFSIISFDRAGEILGESGTFEEELPGQFEGSVISSEHETRF